MRPREARELCRGIPIVLLSIPALLLSCEESGRRPQFLAEDTRVELGLGGAHVENGWNTLFVELRNRGATFDGTIEIVGGVSGTSGALIEPDAVTYRTRIEIPEGERRRLTVPVRAQDWSQVTIRYHQERRNRRTRFDFAHRFELPPVKPTATHVLAVGNRPPDFGRLAREIEDSHHPAPPNAPLGVVDLRCKVTRLAPARLPSHWSAYHPFQLILLYDTTLIDAPLGAVEAIASWVARGGSLVVFPGPASASGVPPKLSELLNAKAGRPLGVPPERVLRALAATELDGYYRPWQPGPGARESDIGLSVVSRHGAGTVTTFNFTPAGTTFPGSKEAPGLYTDLAPAIVRGRSSAGNPGASLRTIEGLIASKLFEISSFQTPAGVVVAVGLGLYLTFGFFVPHAIFKRRRRRELTFVFVVVTAALATGAVYRYGVLNIGDRTEVVEINVMRLHPEARSAELTSFVGLLSPRHVSFDLLQEPSGPRPIGEFTRSALPLRGDLFSDYRLQKLQTDPTTVHVDRRGRVRLEEIALRPNAIRCFRVDDRIASQEIVAVSYTRSGEDKISGVTVRNDGGQPLFGMVIDGWECASLGWLRPGEERDCLSVLETEKTDLEALQLSWLHQELPLLRSGPPELPVGWMEDRRRNVLKLIVLGLINEARGLGSTGYAWQALMPAAPGNAAANRQRGLKEDLRPYEPRMLLLVGDEPLFQPGERVTERRALTCIILELPSLVEST